MGEEAVAGPADTMETIAYSRRDAAVLAHAQDASHRNRFGSVPMVYLRHRPGALEHKSDARGAARTVISRAERSIHGGWWHSRSQGCKALIILSERGSRRNGLMLHR